MHSESNFHPKYVSPVRGTFSFSDVLFPLALFYWEILFAIGVFGRPDLTGLIPILLFSVSLGTLLQLLVSLFPCRVNRILRQVLLVVLAIPYGVEYFVFRMFKVLYDVSTIRNGAGGVVNGFMGDALGLITSPTGILFLIFLLLPAVLYGIFGFRRDPATRPGLRPMLARLAAVLVLYGLGWGSVHLSDLTWNVYGGSGYNFEAAVQYFGLMTGVRLDFRYIDSKDAPLQFEDFATEPVPVSEPQPSAETAPEDPQEAQPVVYGKNELDLPFDRCTGATKDLAAYVAAQTPSSKNAYTGKFAGKNLIFISAEAFTAEVIDPERTPTLYRLANSGFRFTDYYQPTSAGTTGGEVLNLFGVLPTEGGSSMGLATSHYVVDIATFLTPLGYTGGTFHNNDCTFYSRNRTHNLLGYPDGFMAMGSGMEEYVVNKFPQSDLEMMQGILPKYLEQDKPFNLYFMSVSGHSVYYWKNSSAIKHKDEVENLPYSEKVKAYLACQMELEYALKYTVEALEAAGKADDTVIVISADHFPYGLDDSSALGSLHNLSELYGFNVTTRFERDHNRLIIWSGCLEKEEPVEISAPTSSLDILPTLCNLFGVDFDSRLFVGRDVFSDRAPLVFNLSYDWKTELGTFTPTTGFIPVSADTDVPEGYVDQMKTIVKNKVTYCRGVLNNDFYGKLFRESNPK